MSKVLMNPFFVWIRMNVYVWKSNNDWNIKLINHNGISVLTFNPSFTHGYQWLRLYVLDVRAVDAGHEFSCLAREETERSVQDMQTMMLSERGKLNYEPSTAA